MKRKGNSAAAPKRARRDGDGDDGEGEADEGGIAPPPSPPHEAHTDAAASSSSLGPAAGAASSSSAPGGETPVVGWGSHLKLNADGSETIQVGYNYCIVTAFAKRGTAALTHQDALPIVNAEIARAGLPLIKLSNFTAHASKLRDVMPKIRDLARNQVTADSSPEQLKAFAARPEVLALLRKVKLHIHGGDVIKLILTPREWPEAQEKKKPGAAAAEPTVDLQHDGSSDEGGGSSKRRKRWQRNVLERLQSVEKELHELRKVCAATSTAVSQMKATLAGVASAVQAGPSGGTKRSRSPSSSSSSSSSSDSGSSSSSSAFAHPAPKSGAPKSGVPRAGAPKAHSSKQG